MRTIVGVTIVGAAGVLATSASSARTPPSRPFSTLSLETFRLIEDGAHLIASLNGVGSLAAVYAGVIVGRMV